MRASEGGRYKSEKTQEGRASPAPTKAREEGGIKPPLQLGDAGIEGGSFDGVVEEILRAWGVSERGAGFGGGGYAAHQEEGWGWERRELG